MAIINYTQDNINYDLDTTSYSATVTGRADDTLTAIVIPSTLIYESNSYTVDTIGNVAFSGTDIISLSLPNTITKIGYNAFDNCTSLAGNLVLPSGLTSLGQFAFAGCTSLTGNILIPATITTMGAGVFQDCTGFTGVTIEDGVTTISDQLFYRCTSLTGDLIIPDSVLYVGTSAFNGCTALSGTGVFSLGQSVQTIENYAFSQCQLNGTIVIPHSVTTLNIGAFSQGHVEADSFKELVEVDLDFDDLIGLPDATDLEARLNNEYEDTKTSSTQHSFIYKSANKDEIEINYAQALNKSFDFLFIMDISDSMQNTAPAMLGAVENRYPRIVYASQIIDKLSKELLFNDYDNRVAITAFSSSNTPASWNTADFVDDYDFIQEAIWHNYAWEGDGTDYSYGLNSAINIINNRTDISRDVVVIFVSDGKPNEGNRDSHGVYGGNEAQILRNIGASLYPISIFLSDSELADARTALTAISYDKQTYYEARDVDSFQSIIAEVIGDAVTEIEGTTITEQLSSHFEPLTGTATDLTVDCGTADFDQDGNIVWDLSGCSLGEIVSLRIKTRINGASIPQTDYYPTNENLAIEDPCGTILEESPEIYITRSLAGLKAVVDEDGDGYASPGEKLTYTITVTNSGDVAYENLTIRDSLNDVLPYVDSDATVVTIDIDGMTTDRALSELINGFTINLEGGQRALISFEVTVLASLDTREVTALVNQATVGELIVETQIETRGASNYSVVKTARNINGDNIDGATIREGEDIRYTIRATALSVDEPIGPIIFLDEISDFIYHVGDEDTVTTMSGETFSVHPTYSGSVMSVETQRYLHSVGDWIEVEFLAHVREGTGGNVVVNQSIVTASELERETNITVVTIYAMEGDPEKAVASTSTAGKNGAFVKVNDEITYDIIYKNYDSVSATILISDKLPQGLDFVSATDGGSYSDTTRTVTWTVVDVPQDSQGTVSLVVRVNKNADWAVGNYALVQVGANEPRFTNYVENHIQGAGCRLLSRSTNCRRSIKGRKVWRDGGNIGDTRPKAVEIVLNRDGELYKSAMIDSQGDGKYEFGCLPIWKNSGQKYTYQVDEPEALQGYTKTIEGNNVINTAEPVFRTITATKKWDDDNNSAGIRPSEITVNLLQNGVAYRTAIVPSPPDIEDTATFDFENVPLFDAEGVVYTYTLEEQTVPQYTTEIVGFVITNTQAVFGLSIDYLNNGGEGDFSDERTPFASIYRIRTLAETGITHPGSGFWFDSWNTSQDGQGERFVENQMIEITENLNLYAQWYQNFNVSYSRNTDSPYVNIKTGRSDEPYTILPPKSVNIFRDGYNFTSWNTKANGKGVAYQPGDIVTLSANLQLYAQWEEVPTME